MSDYVYKNSYNLNVLAGYGGNTTHDAETGQARCTAVADWINTNLGDIFEASTDFTSNTGVYYIYIYYKGTNSGFRIDLGITSTTTNNNRTNMIHCGSVITQLTLVSILPKSLVNLLVIKSKYGVIAGLYKDDVASNILTMGINKFDGTFVSCVFNGSTMYVSNAENSETSMDLPYRGISEQAVLSKFNVPTLDIVPDGIYMSTGASSNNCGIFTVGGGTDKFCEVANGSTYVGYALLLEEPEEGDYIFSETSTAETVSDDTTDDTE